MRSTVAPLKVVANLPQGNKLEAVRSVNPGNLQLTKDFQNSKNLSAEAKAAPAKSKGKRAPDWLLLDSEPEAVKTEVSWQKLLGDTDESNNFFGLSPELAFASRPLLPRSQSTQRRTC